jgi:protein-tyrosine-phosphatase
MRILIVCTGNILRSVMAEYLLRSELPHIYVESAGYPCKRPRIKPLPSVREAMKEIDLDVSEHRSKLVTPETIDRSDLILVMTRRQKKAHYHRLSQRQTKLIGLENSIQAHRATILQTYSI